ncbi:MAG TPA: hypothetical protein VH497_03680 [Vicinamibacterales bacterium]
MQATFVSLSMATILPLTLACGSAAPAAPAPVTTANLPALEGVWVGMGADSQGSTRVTWQLSQSAAALSGTVKTQAIDPNDGSCGSCHRNKSGMFTGTISGDIVSLTMFFAAGADGDPTPACTATLVGSASARAADELLTTYSGSDSCEGAFERGTLSMTRGR